MSGIAILVGNSEYDSQMSLPCCHNDLIVLNDLVTATGRYEKVEVIEDLDADALKSNIRKILVELDHIDKIFFYFSGHGHFDGDLFLPQLILTRNNPMKRAYPILTSIRC